MWSRWVLELDTARTRDPGYFSAIQRESEPQPHPRSRTVIPSRNPALSQVIASIASSASAREETPGGK